LKVIAFSPHGKGGTFPRSHALRGNASGQIRHDEDHHDE